MVDSEPENLGIIERFRLFLIAEEETWNISSQELLE